MVGSSRSDLVGQKTRERKFKAIIDDNSFNILTPSTNCEDNFRATTKLTTTNIAAAYNISFDSRTHYMTDKGRARGVRPRGRGGPPFQGRGGGGFDAGTGDGGRGRGRGRGHFQGPLIYPPDQPVSLPTRLTDGSQDALIKTFQSVRYQVGRPLRPGYGTLGGPIKLRANLFAVKLPKGPFYSYVVDITDVTPKGALAGGAGRGKGKGKKQTTPDSIKSDTKRRIFELIEANVNFQPYKSAIVHDYSQRIISTRQLPQPLGLKIKFIEEGETQPGHQAAIYEISIQYQGEIDLNHINRFTDGDITCRSIDQTSFAYDSELQPTISALNIILQYHASRSGVRLGKRDSNGESKFFFDTEQFRRPLVPGVEAWQGFFISVRPAFGQLMVNVNVCYTAFMKPQNLAKALLDRGFNYPNAMPNMSFDMINSLKVKMKHLGHTKRLFKIGDKSARDQFFTDKDGKKISVEGYFKQQYEITLQYPNNLPVVSVGQINKGGRKDDKWVPAELCDIVKGSPRRGKLSDEETRQMIRVACNPPDIHARNIIETGFPILGFQEQKRAPILATFGIEVGNEMSNIPARVLRPPKLVYGEGRTSMREGAWNVLDFKFQRGAEVNSWWVLHVNDPKRWDDNRRNNNQSSVERSQLETITEKLRDKCIKSGMSIPKPNLLPTAQLNRINNDDFSRTKALSEIHKILGEACQTHGKPSFVVVFLERVDKHIYPGIKRIGDVILGIHTVHMQLSKVLDQNLNKLDQYMSNVALKINTKLGGINHKLDDGAMSWLRKESTMLVGIDVTHAGPGTKPGTPSVVAAVASIDDSFVHFPASLRLQKHAKNKETLDQKDETLKKMFIERLEVYAKHNKDRLPERIFLFRDGVSEGQFPDIIREELPQILDAFKSIRDKYRPFLSIIICQKRHHTKFFATDIADADKNGNTKPGTVIDRGITSVFDFDFYLQAHAGIQGTVKMTHYTVVYDETQFTPDEIQQGTYNTSYLYARTSRSVSLIPPVYYADLACERGRCYLNNFLATDDNIASSIRSGKTDIEREKQRVYDEAVQYWGGGLHDDIRDSMFYL
ncbi:hypothetical protein APHAL10511_000441 [Amanita phalloides]|nr:hypothetical protein APHAL10511_000441 [Amanita phalloides]